MFTIDQIKAAHSKVKTGADFPAYIWDLKQLGVTDYQTFVKDGHTDYHGPSGYEVSSDSGYEELTIQPFCDVEQFSTILKAHQQGQTDYPTFMRDCARTGVCYWLVSLDEMTCTYFDGIGNTVLTEAISY